MPLVSILIPCYNSAAWLAATLESALAQTWPEKEVIVVDDGSRDASREIAQRYVSRGVQAVAQANRGASSARNHALRLARGDFIQFLDADDLLAPDKIERQMKQLSTHPAGMLGSSAWGRFHQAPQEATFEPKANWRDLGGVEFLQLHYEKECMMQPAAWLAPRHLLERAGPWDESLSLNDDGEYFARVMLASPGIVFCPEARSYYRSGLGGSLSRRSDRKSLDSLYRSVELTAGHLLAADQTPRTRAALAYAWKWTAFELYPGAPDLTDRALANSQQLGGSSRPFPAGRRFQIPAKFIGWRMAKRLFYRPAAPPPKP